MSRKDAVVLASRAVAVLLSVSALTEVSYLPSYYIRFSTMRKGRRSLRWSIGAATIFWRSDF